MCAPSQGAMLPYGLKVPSPYFPFGPNGGLTQVHLSALDFQRSQINDYNVRVQLGLRNYQNSVGLSSFQAYFNDPYTQAYFYKHDPRARFVQEEPKPSHSYIGLIGMAILNSKEKKLVLSDIYQWILDNYPYFRTRGPGWRNSIRHNLSLNDCFIKSGRSANGKGHYWAVHPANVEDFERGDFRRRRAQRKVRRHMGLSVPDDDDSPTPSPTQSWTHNDVTQDSDVGHIDPLAIPNDHAVRPVQSRPDADHMVISHSNPTYGPVPGQPRKPSRKRLFDMASLLAPDDDDDEDKNGVQESHKQQMHSQQIHASGFTFHPIQEQKPQDNTDSLHDKNIDKIESNFIHEPVANINCDKKKDTHFFSDDENENDEIQVTSGEESPSEEQDSDYFTGRILLTSDKFKNDNNCAIASQIRTETGAMETSRHSSSPHETTQKNENALDLSSPIQFANEKKLTNSPCTPEVHKNMECQLFENTLVLKNDAACFKEHNVKSDEAQLKTQNNCDKCNGHRRSEMAHELHGRSSTCNNCEQTRHKKSDSVMGKVSYRDKYELRDENILSRINGSFDNARSLTDKMHYYRSELQGARRTHHQSTGESQFVTMDSGASENERSVDVEATGRTPENLVFVSEAARIPSDHLLWADMAKNSLPRDRLSAFSSLGIRHQAVYSPFQLRNFHHTSQRMLPGSYAYESQYNRSYALHTGNFVIDAYNLAEEWGQWRSQGGPHQQ
ncbi:unnamed protein product [Candidula unifasciata]|uniref:Fork-head domain-containing protein n=1 Tax=Candidula unifasciata TaxID=100452 RepID=A0A8S3YIN4_9EUPU|nr:unnamed protein product [Candidula unifasciata]